MESLVDYGRRYRIGLPISSSRADCGTIRRHVLHFIFPEISSGERRKARVVPIVRFARTLNRDFDAVKNAIEMPWNNGQAEGQINRLKTLKRAMYGRAGPELLRARMLPFRHTD